MKHTERQHEKITPVILCGGSGTRLWPLSRKLQPKQFLSLVDEETMFTKTYQRFVSDDFTDPVIICNEKLRFLVSRELHKNNGHGAIILEPEGRDTAAAITIGALHVAEMYGLDAPMLILPADHLMADVEGFHHAVKQSLPLIHDGKMVTFGVVPDRPETGYGYIERGESLDRGYRVQRFTEKPDLKTAEQFLASGKYLWNAGIFFFTPRTFIGTLYMHAPEISRTCTYAYRDAQPDLHFLRLQENFLKCPKISVDYAVMEHAKNLAVVPIDIGWNDLGHWTSIADETAYTDKGAESHAIGDVHLHESSNCYVRSENGFVAALGVTDLVIVQTADATLVAHKDHVQSTKNIVKYLEQLPGRTEHISHATDHHIWGTRESLDKGDTYAVRKLVIDPHAIVQLQIHQLRSEHWIVVKGAAEITRNNKTTLVQENESIFVEAGVAHQLRNPENTKLELIEIQTGAYLGEDDIVRVQKTPGDFTQQKESPKVHSISLSRPQ